MTVAWLVDPEHPEQSGRGALVLQMDDEATAATLVETVLPRLARFWANARSASASAPAVVPAGDRAAARFLGRPGGQPLEARAVGRLVLVGWGERTLEAMEGAAKNPRSSLLESVQAAAQERAAGRLVRFAAFWPGRIRLPIPGLNGPTSLARCLAQGPPITWAGWVGAGGALDRVDWPGLHRQVERFLASLPLQRPGQR